MKVVVFPDIILDLLKGDPFVLDVFQFHQAMGLELVSCDILEEDVKTITQPPSNEDWNTKIGRIKPQLNAIVRIDREKYLSVSDLAAQSTYDEDIEPYMAAYFFTHADAIWTNETSEISGSRVRNLYIEPGRSPDYFHARFRNVDPDEVYFRGTWVPVANQPPPVTIEVNKRKGNAYRFVSVEPIPGMRFTREDAEDFLGRAGVYRHPRDDASDRDFDKEEDKEDDKWEEEAEDVAEKGDDDEEDY